MIIKCIIRNYRDNEIMKSLNRDETMSEIQELRQFMKTSGTNTAAAARALGVSWQTVHRWINGRNEPSPVIRRLLRAELERMKAGGGE